MSFQITDDMIKNLANDIVSNFVIQNKKTSCFSELPNLENSSDEMLIVQFKNKSGTKKKFSRFDFGAVWHGNYYCKAEKGKFGSPTKPDHFAMIRENIQVVNKPGRVLSPITSEPIEAKDVFVLPPGSLDTLIQKKSYILLYLTLLVTRRTLNKEFKFIQMLQPEYIREARRIISNG